MKFIEAVPASVELTEREEETRDRFNLYHDIQHLSVRDAAMEALRHHKGGKPSKEFVEWLSQGTLTKIGGEIVTPAA